MVVKYLRQLRKVKLEDFNYKSFNSYKFMISESYDTNNAFPEMECVGILWDTNDECKLLKQSKRLYLVVAFYNLSDSFGIEYNRADFVGVAITKKRAERVKELLEKSYEWNMLKKRSIPPKEKEERMKEIEEAVGCEVANVDEYPSWVDMVPKLTEKYIYYFPYDCLSDSLKCVRIYEVELNRQYEIPEDVCPIK